MNCCIEKTVCVLVAIYSAVNVFLVGPWTWPHSDGRIYSFFTSSGILAAFGTIVSAIAFKFLRRQRVHWRLIGLAVGTLVAVEIFNLWILWQAIRSS